MGRYSTINEQFRPMSYQEMLAPVQMADTEHKNLEQSQADLAAASIQWEDKLKNETDPTLRNLYQGYADNLRKEAETLASKGLDGNSRRGLLDLRTQYARDIMPIEEAYKKYQGELARRQQLKDTDSSYIFEKGDLNITGYYNNPETQYKAMKVDEVYKTAAADFGNYATKFLEKNIGKWKSTAFGQMLERRMHSGATEEQILDLIENDPSAPEELKELYSTIKESYFERGNWSEEDQTKIVDALNRGAIYGIGSIKSDLQTNQNFVPNGSRGGGTPPDKPFYNAYDLDSPHLTGEEGSKLQNNLKEKYFTKDGGVKLNAKVPLVETLQSGNVTDRTKKTTIDVPYYDNKGNVLSEEQFIKNADNNPNAKKAYNHFRKEMKSIGLDVDKGFTAKEFKEAVNSIGTESTVTIQALDVPFDDTHKALSKMINLTRGTDDVTSLKRITSFDKDGVVETDGKNIKANDVFKTKGNTQNYENDPIFFLPPNKNTKGLIIGYGESKYLAPWEYLGKTGKQIEENINTMSDYNETLNSNISEEDKQNILSSLSDLQATNAALLNTVVMGEYTAPKAKTNK